MYLRPNLLQAQSIKIFIKNLGCSELIVLLEGSQTPYGEDNTQWRHLINLNSNPHSKSLHVSCNHYFFRTCYVPVGAHFLITRIFQCFSKFL